MILANAVGGGLSYKTLQVGSDAPANLVLHLLNTLVLFLVLESMTGAPGRSAIVAALFAWIERTSKLDNPAVYGIRYTGGEQRAI